MEAGNQKEVGNQGEVIVSPFPVAPLGVTFPPQAEISTSEMEVRIRERVNQLLADGAFSSADMAFVKSFVLPAASGSFQVSEELLERLRRVAQIWDVSLKPKEITSHRPLLGPVIVAFKRLLYPVLSLFLADTLRQQRDFNAAVLRCLVEMARESRNER